MGLLNRGEKSGPVPRRTGDKYTDKALQAMIEELDAAGANGQASCLLTIQMGPKGRSAGTSVPIYAEHLQAEGHVITNVDRSDWGPAYLTVTPRDSAQTASQSAGGQPDIADQIGKLSQLHASGALSDDEFAEAKRRLLS